LLVLIETHDIESNIKELSLLLSKLLTVLIFYGEVVLFFLGTVQKCTKTHNTAGQLSVTAMNP
jgi:hypothetical protein